LNALSYILPGPGQTRYTLPAKGSDVPTSGYNPGGRKPRLRAVTHFGVQAWSLAVDEYAIFWPACPDIRGGCRPTGALIRNHGLCPWGST